MARGAGSSPGHPPHTRALRPVVHPYELPEPEETGWAPIEPEVFEQDNPVVATLYGPDGEALLEIHERRIVVFGYQKG
jgi:hypothetical protein